MSAHGVSLRTKGMHCPGCEHIIEDSVTRLPGIKRVKADYATETVAVVFDPASTKIEDICAAISQKGYRCFLPDEAKAPPSRLRQLAGLVLGIAGIIAIILLDTELISGSGIPDATEHMSFGLILVLGLLTGFHCVGMCGGFVLSYTANAARLGQPSYLAHVLYGSGKTLSYTGIGATFGLLGAIITFTPFLRGIAGLFAGAFLIIFGLNMLGLFAPLRRLRLKLPSPLARSIDKTAQGTNRPFAIGLLNGLMIACGPLQAMYVMAAGTGSALEGALMLFTFGVGTLPVLLSFGVLTTMISGALTHRLLRASGAIVVILGAVMINRGLILIGSGHDLKSMITTLSTGVKTELATASNTQAPVGVQTITMDVIRSGYAPNHFVLRQGMPVKWVIRGKEITPCNKRIVVPSLNLEFDVAEGEQIIEFTPEKPGLVPWSCWMGMLHGNFLVVGNETAVAQASPQPDPKAEPADQDDVGSDRSRMAGTDSNRSERDAGGEPAPAFSPVPAPGTGQIPVADHSPAAIATAEPGRPAPELAETYTVARGDSLSKIAARLYQDETAWRAIAKANPGLDPRKLRPGQVIRLPRPVPKENFLPGRM